MQHVAFAMWMLQHVILALYATAIQLHGNKLHTRTLPLLYTVLHHNVASLIDRYWIKSTFGPSLSDCLATQALCNALKLCVCTHSIHTYAG